MTRKNYIEKFAARLGMTFSEVDRIMRESVNLIYEELSIGGTVQWSGFGTFSVSHRMPRLGVNPKQPSVRITIPELNTPKFKAGEAFKEAIKLK